MTHRSRRVAAMILVLSLAAWASGVAASGLPAPPVPGDPLAGGVPAYEGEPANPRPLNSFPVPQHPFMAPNGTSNIHNDAYQTDAYTVPGPLGRNVRVRSAFLAAECASLGFDREGHVITVCVGLDAPKLVRFHRETLEVLALLPLPPRAARGTGSSPLTDFSGGGYFYLDHRYRAVVPTAVREIWVVEPPTGDGPGAFRVVRRYGVGAVVEPQEGIVSALPDWSGRIWFVTSQGGVGTVDPETGRVQGLRLPGETISNSFAVDETGGVYVVSDHALYRFDAGPGGEPRITWREAYDRGTRIKPGQVNYGSGTTPTLIGDRYVAITDNADPYMHVLVYRRDRSVSGARRVCAVPVFGPYRGATDNSLVAVGRSLIVVNNYGYSGPLATRGGATTEPGIARVDFTPGGACRTAWTSPEIVPSVVPKVSLATGLLYVYTKPARPDGTDAWYFTAVDFRTGRTVYRVLVGTGLGYNNHYAPISLGPDGAAYVGLLGGLARVADGNR